MTILLTPEDLFSMDEMTDDVLKDYLKKWSLVKLLGIFQALSGREYHSATSPTKQRYYLRRYIFRAIRDGVNSNGPVQLTDPAIQAKLKAAWADHHTSYQAFLRRAVANHLRHLGDSKLAEEIDGE